jgi:hypothetical protein
LFLVEIIILTHVAPLEDHLSIVSIMDLVCLTSLEQYNDKIVSSSAQAMRIFINLLLLQHLYIRPKKKQYFYGNSFASDEIPRFWSGMPTFGRFERCIFYDIVFLICEQP